MCELEAVCISRDGDALQFAKSKAKLTGRSVLLWSCRDCSQWHVDERIHIETSMKNRDVLLAYPDGKVKRFMIRVRPVMTS